MGAASGGVTEGVKRLFNCPYSDSNLRDQIETSYSLVSCGRWNKRSKVMLIFLTKSKEESGGI